MECRCQLNGFMPPGCAVHVFADWPVGFISFCHGFSSAHQPVSADEYIVGDGHVFVISRKAQ